MHPLLDALTGWVFYGGLSVALGVVFGRVFVLSGPGVSEVLDLPHLHRSAARIGLAASAVLLAGLGLVLFRQLIEFHDPFVTWGEDFRFLLLDTRWGKSWRLGLLGAVIAAVGFALARRSGAGWWLAAAAILPMGVFPAFTGHANSGDLRALTLTADSLHVWAAGGWAGTLAMVLALEIGARRGAGASLLPYLVPRFSKVAMVSVAVLALTGLVAAVVHLESVAALWQQKYGRLLVLKLALVAGVLALGFVNWRHITPRLGDQDGQRDMRRTASLELLIANLVLAVTAILTRTAPLDP